jgi:site-specific recombinase XerD
MEDAILKEFKEFLSHTKQVNEKTQYRYGRWIKDLDISKLTQEYLNEYVQKKGNHSQVRGAILNFLEMTGLGKNFDMPPKSTGRVKKRIIKDVSPDEIKMISNYLYGKSFKKGLIFDITYQGALRRFEVPTICINSFKWLEWISNPKLPCKLAIKGKGNKDRIVLVNPEVAEKIFIRYSKKYDLSDIDNLVAFSNSPSSLFTTDEGSVIGDYRVWQIVRNASRKVLGRNVRTHELRHARANELERMGVPIKDIKNYLGHSSLAVTEIYLHTSEKESIENIQNILQRNSN